MSVLHIGKENFEEVVLNNKGTVLVDFWATWCGPCKMLAPILEEVAADRPDVTVCKIDVDEQPELASQYGIMSIPTLIVFKDGKLVTQQTGARPKAQILSML